MWVACIHGVTVSAYAGRGPDCPDCAELDVLRRLEAYARGRALEDTAGILAQLDALRATRPGSLPAPSA